jgi:hypothetical protein
MRLMVQILSDTITGVDITATAGAATTTTTTTTTTLIKTL